ncbi:MAG: hypothetical protein ACRD36_13425, partial [Candidatus Acidiferrum sp.]
RRIADDRRTPLDRYGAMKSALRERRGPLRQSLGRDLVRELNWHLQALMEGSPASRFKEITDLENRKAEIEGRGGKSAFLPTCRTTTATTQVMISARLNELVAPW